MKEKILKLWNELDDDVQIVLVAFAFCLGLGAIGAIENDRVTDELCGDDRSKCSKVVTEGNCLYAGPCDQIHWELKSTERK